MVVRIDGEINKRVWGMISLAQKAGVVASGEGRAQDAIRSGDSSLIIVSQDASNNTLKRFSNMGEYRDIPVLVMSDRYELGHAIGKKFAVVLTICDNGFSDNIKKILVI